MKRMFGAAALVVALTAGGAAMAQTTSGGSGSDSGAAGSSGMGETKETYQSTGPGASGMSPEERKQMDQCTKYATWDYCKLRMLGR